MADNTEVPMGDSPGGNPGGPKVKGPLKLNKSDLATHLKRKPIAIAAAGIVAGVVAVGYVAVAIMPGMGGSSTEATTPHVQQAPAMQVPKRQSIPTPRVKPATAATQSAANTAPPKVKPVPLDSSVPAQGAPATPTDKAQLTAFKTAISGAGASSGAGWGGGQSQTKPATPTASGLIADLKAAEPHKPKKATNVYDTHLVRQEVSPYELLQGSVIPAVLETGIKSDIAGQVKAVVEHPVYNSLNGASVLIPAGATLVGTYKSGAAMGQNRVAVMWTRVEFPNGTYMQLGKLTGSSPSGYAGFHDLVNDHTWEIFKNALLLSLIDMGTAIASPQSSSSNTTGVTGDEALQDGEQSLVQTFGQAETQLFQKYVNIAPTITIRPGYLFNVVVAKDLVFPGPYVHGANETGNGQVNSPAMPSEMNPYGG